MLDILLGVLHYRTVTTQNVCNNTNTAIRPNRIAKTILGGFRYFASRDIRQLSTIIDWHMPEYLPLLPLSIDLLTVLLVCKSNHFCVGTEKDLALVHKIALVPQIMSNLNCSRIVASTRFVITFAPVHSMWKHFSSNSQIRSTWSKMSMLPLWRWTENPNVQKRTLSSSPSWLLHPQHAPRH